jgi:type IV pilus assembly protein PilW
MRFIVEDVRMAGFHDLSVGAAPSPVINASSPSIPASSDGGNSGNDRMTISYHGFRDCEGNPSGATARTEIINTYWVDDDQKLKCRGNQAVPLTSGVTLLDGVESFQVLYGMDTTPNDQVAFASQYVPADQLSTHFANDHLVLSLKIAMLLKNSVPAIGSGPAKDFYLLDTSKEVDTSQSLFQQFSTTVTLRNYPWSKI